MTLDQTSETQAALAEMWRELFELNDTLSGDESFVDLGGNSLLATLLANRIEEQFRVRPTMVEILSKTLGELAVWVDEAGRVGRPA